MPIHVVGLGQDPGNLPDESEHIVEHAQVLFGGRDLLAHFEDHPAEKIAITAPLDGVVDRINEAYADKKTVVVLADGDPLFYGIGTTLIDRMGPEDIRIYPNVTTLQMAAARVKIPWQDVAAVSLHGRDDHAPLFSALITTQWVAVFTDAKSIPSAIAQILYDKAGETHWMWVLENLEAENERMGRYTLDEARRKSFAARNLVLLERRHEPEIPLGLGTPDELFMRENELITKGAVRATSIAALRLRNDSVLWDLGAGCGSVGIEAASICHKGRVFSVEKNADRVAMIRENIRRTAAWPVEIVHGSMPGCLADLAPPDRVFIGGGLCRDGVLDTACDRLAPGGRMVCNAILLDSLTRARAAFEEREWDFSVTLIQVAETSPLAGKIRLAGANPVFVVVADKPLD